MFLGDGAFPLVGRLLAGLFLQQGMGIDLLAAVAPVAAGLRTLHHIHVGLSERQIAVAIATPRLGSGRLPVPPAKDLTARLGRRTGLPALWWLY